MAKNNTEWLDIKSFTKISGAAVSTVYFWFDQEKVKRRGKKGSFEYKYEPLKHKRPPKKDPPKEIDPLHIDEVVKAEDKIREEKKEQGLKRWGLFEKEDIAWLINYAHTRKMTISEAIGKFVKHARALDALELYRDR